MNTANRPGLLGTVITLGVVLALAVVVTTSNAPAHASSHPDLSITGGSQYHVPLVPGGSFTLTARLQNEGDGEAPATTLRYYSSTDTTITTSDTEVGTDSVDALASGEFANHRINLTAPSSPGTYNYGACVDAVTNETDTTNNCTGYISLRVQEPDRPDLTVTQVRASSSPVAGATFTLSTVVINAGDAESTATTLRYYRSTDSTVDTSDTELGTDSIGALEKSRGSPESLNVTAPSTAGTYHYAVCVDTVTNESNTTNNCQNYTTQVTVHAANSAATGAPAISGTAQVGQTLTASTSGISDADGLSNVTYSYQWLADDTEIDGATSSSYTVQSSDEDKVIKVRVTFTDDADNEESLTSAETSAVVLGGL